MTPEVGGLLGLLRRAGRGLLRQPRRVAWLAPAGWMLLIWWLSSRPAVPDPSRGQAWSFGWNLAHAPAFGLLTLLLLPVAPRTEGWARLGRRELLCIGLVAIGYGAVDEWHQVGVHGRHGSVLDVITDAVGVLCVLWTAAYVGRAGAREGGLRLRLAAGLGLCLAAAGSTTFLLTDA